MAPVTEDLRLPAVRRVQAHHDVPDAMRSDVRLLGELLGRVLREDGGQSLLDDVEHLRALTIRAQDEPGPEALESAEALVAGLSSTRAEEVARAFTCYFHLANLAEEHHRVRVLRAAGVPDDDSLAGAVAELAAEVGEDEARARLQALEFRPVVTAHPTEARRRAVARAIRRISGLLDERDGLTSGSVAMAENERRLLAEIDTLWRTSPLRGRKPRVLDEVRTVMDVFDTTFFGVVPAVYRRVDDRLQGDQAGVTSPVIRPFLRLGTWIGGDRDGNPNVTADITRAAAVEASEHVLSALAAAARRAGEVLTLGAQGTPPSAELTAWWQLQRSLSGPSTSAAVEAAPDEPHRAALLVIADRIDATRRRDADLGYADAERLEGDLLLVQRSLRQAGAARAAHGDLQRLLWQVQSFGFHLAELEVRQHSHVHAAALADIDEHGIDGPLQPTTVEVLDTFRAVGSVQRRLGPKAAQRYIVSFTRSAEDIAAVYRLARFAFPDPAQAPVIDVIPLFETSADLAASVDVLEAMLELAPVRDRLGANGGRMEIMLGYSDSSKDVGPVAATLELDVAQSAITEWGHRHGLTLTLFHGRGGALGRGGGPANRAVLAQPPGSVDGRFKLTEQGEVIFARYGDPVIAARHIEQVAAATLLAGAPSTERRNAAATQRFAALAHQLEEESRAQFHRLVHAEGFASWFGQVTPLEEVGLLPIGSRPARRGLSVESLEDLRAIPWVFSWSQARTNLAGWFGLGTALESVGDVAELRSAYAEWPLFTTLIDNVEMSLAKADERIAVRYLALGDRPDLADLVLSEMALTRRWVLATTDSETALAHRRVLGRAINLRAPYVDALSLIQLRALRRLRTEEVGEDGEGVRRLLLLTVNGVAAGLQNTG